VTPAARALALLPLLSLAATFSPRAAAGPLADRLAAAPSPGAALAAGALPPAIDAVDRAAEAALADWRQDPAGAAAAWSAAPRTTRAGTPRLPVEAGAPHGAVHLARALWSPEEPAVRAAALAAAARLVPGWAEVAPALLLEDDVELRRVTVDLLVDAPAALAAPALWVAIDDPAPAVRAAAMRALGGHEAAVAPALLMRGINDNDALVREAALRSAGWVGLRAAAPDARAALTAAEPAVRLAGAQALRRLDPAAFAAAQPTLAADADPRLRQLAAPR
jgi:hypothetical protein